MAKARSGARNYKTKSGTNVEEIYGNNDKGRTISYRSNTDSRKQFGENLHSLNSASRIQDKANPDLHHFKSNRSETTSDFWAYNEDHEGTVNLARKDKDKVREQRERLQMEINKERNALENDPANRIKRGYNAKTRARLAELDRREKRIMGTEQAYRDFYALDPAENEGAKNGAKGSVGG